MKKNDATSITQTLKKKGIEVRWVRELPTSQLVAFGCKDQTLQGSNVVLLLPMDPIGLTVISDNVLQTLARISSGVILPGDARNACSNYLNVTASLSC